MAKPDKSAQLELVERHKRIPQKTQETLRKMINRRYAELCGTPKAEARPVAPKTKPYLADLWPEREREPDPELQLDKADN